MCIQRYHRNAKFLMILLKVEGSCYFFYTFEATSETVVQFLAVKLENITRLSREVCGDTWFVEMSLEIHRTRVDNALNNLNSYGIWHCSELQVDWMPKSLILWINYFYNESNSETKAIMEKKRKQKLNKNITKKYAVYKMCNIFSLNCSLMYVFLGCFLRTGVNEVLCHANTLQHSLSSQVWQDIWKRPTAFMMNCSFGIGHNKKKIRFQV